MPLRTLKSIVLFILLLLGAGCQPAPTKAMQEPTVCPAVEESAAQAIVVLLLDRSESVLTPSHADLLRLVQYLPAGSELVGVFVQENSYPGAAFLHDVIPASPQAVACKATNPFDYQAKQACAQAQRRAKMLETCVTAARQRISTTLQGLTVGPAQRTDVSGALAVAAEQFAAYPPTGRWLIVYSALDDTVHRQRPKLLVPLQGARVFVRMPRAVLGEQGSHRLAAFKESLDSAGAQVAAPPFEMAWPVVFRQAERLFAAPIPLVDPSTPLAAFMATLAPGPYGVIVASLATETEARQAVRTIHAQYPELRPSHGLAADGKSWAVSIGDFYAREAAEALKAKAKALGLRRDTFVWDSRRY